MRIISIKRLLSSILVICLVFSQLPLIARAEETPLGISEGSTDSDTLPTDDKELPADTDKNLSGTPATPVSISQDDVCSIGDEGYATLNAAVSAAGDGDTIRILKNNTLTGPLSITKSITLTSADSIMMNTGGNKITVSGGKTLTLNGSLTVSGNNSPLVDVSASYFSLGGNAALTHTGTSGFAIHNKNGTVTISSGTVASGYEGIFNDTGTLTVTGGTVTGSTAAIRSYGSTNVYGGSIGSTSFGYGVRILGGAANIWGGNISGKSYAMAVSGTGTAAAISGGTFRAENAQTGYALYCEGGTTTLTGGSFQARVGTNADGSIHINRGTAGSTLSFSGSVGYSELGQHRQFFTTLPDTLPIPAKQGEETIVSLGGMDAARSYVIDAATSEKLGAAPSGQGSGAVVKLNPTEPGNYTLVLTPSGIPGGQSLRLTLPVTVAAGAVNVCKIGATGYTTFEEALSAVKSDETITLLQSIEHKKAVSITGGKNITIDLNSCSLTIDTSTNAWGTANFTALAVVGNFSALNIQGAGKLNVQGIGCGVWATDNGKATVHNAEAAQNVSVLISAGAHAQNGGEITVLEDAKGLIYGAATSSASARVTVKGDAIATANYTANPMNPNNPTFGTAALARSGSVLVEGDAHASGIGGIGAKAEYTSGNVRVLGDIITSGSKSIGAFADSGGKITAEGTIDGETYIKVGSITKTIDQFTTDTAKPGYRAYINGTNTVWVKDSNMPPTTYTVTVQNGITSHAAAEEGTEVTITANSAPDNQQFKEWEISPSVTFTGGTGKTDAAATFTMPAQAVTATAVYEPLPATTYTVTVNNGTGGGSFAEGDTVTVTADPPPSGKRLEGWICSLSELSFINGTGVKDSTVQFIMPAQEVTLTATYEPLPASEYSVTVQSDGNGTAAANVSSAVQGTEITLSATPDDGYQFKEWQVINGSIDIVNSSFSMPGEDVIVKAIFEPIPAKTYTVAVNDSYADFTGSGNYEQGAAVTIHAGSRSNYSFAGWTSPDDITFADPAKATTTFTMLGSDVSVTATWSYTGDEDDNDPVKPTVVTNAVSNIASSGATLSGKVTADGGAPVTTRGFVYSTAANPVIGGTGVSKVTAGSAADSFTARITSLAAGTTYHVRAYAVNSEGTSYGDDVSFTTLTTSKPDKARPPRSPRPTHSASKNTNKSAAIPKTGDASVLHLWLGLLILSTLGGSLLILRHRSKRR